MIKIAIDDGHGMETAGKRTFAFADGTVMRENEFNDPTAKYLGEELKRHGFDVLFVAEETVDTPLQRRVTRANKACADAYISIHANAYGNGWNDANGVESIIYSKIMGKSATYDFAQMVHDGLIAEVKRRNRGIKRSEDLYVLRTTNMHAVLVECGFMTNLEEAELLRQDEYRKKCAKGIAKGICKFYNVEYKEVENMEEKCPDWKTEGEKSLRDLGLMSSIHDPLEVVDIGTLGVILNKLIEIKS